ncbi:ergothioneine biosynthesis protein EgtB [Fulvivirga sp. RKSG066]|uniref:ergothioneine biosynthesis protein EgtB n=1 Tax=Fulvivirga aurantia TaxID=2529383 RepID=UPI0012BCDB3C|nr:ergothioneine biosynthesis protein EgtB [Fulvivirga aurantia]MTI22588.1 ergothioneine biosynthesis protein EgtB [Fulvivirga aurantia]
MIVEDVSLKERFLGVRKKTVDICSRLSPEDHVVQPVEEVSPPKWHLGHTTWFFETFLLKNHLSGYEIYHDQFSFLFNSYYESVGERVIRTNRGNITRPGVEEVLNYRKHVDQAMSQLLDGGLSDDLITLLELGIQHEQQHQELLIYDIKYILGHNPTFPAYLEEKSKADGEVSPIGFMTIEEGVYSIGHQGPGFSFDNELGRHKVYLHGYEIMDRLVTNGEFLEFIEAGGYSYFRHWLSEGWEWVNQNEIKAPEYWHKVNGEWMMYSLRGGLKPLDLHAPVTHISYFEADAYAKWKGLRLPTEFEWEVACAKYGEISRASNFVETEQFETKSAEGKNNQLYGDVWEWTSSAYLPYPFYEAPEGAVGEYNGKFMVNQMVLKGGSCATQRVHIRNTYRNFFHPHLRWMFSGLRLAKNTKTT